MKKKPLSQRVAEANCIVSLVLLLALVLMACASNAVKGKQSNSATVTESATVRVVEAQPIDHTLTCWHVVDEHGNEWMLDGEVLSYTDTLLLWINDCGTPDIVEDDVIVRLWREARLPLAG